MLSAEFSYDVRARHRVPLTGSCKPLPRKAAEQPDGVFPHSDNRHAFVTVRNVRPLNVARSLRAISSSCQSAVDAVHTEDQQARW